VRSLLDIAYICLRIEVGNSIWKEKGALSSAASGAPPSIFPHSASLAIILVAQREICRDSGGDTVEKTLMNKSIFVSLELTEQKE
jgi:hypothetical protein